MSNLFSRGVNRLFLDRNSGRSVDQVQAPGSIGTVQTGFTIPTSGSVVVPIAPADFLADGTTDIVLIQGVLGTLSRAGTVYTFSATSALVSPVAVLINSKIFPAEKGIDPSNLSVINSKRRGKYPFLLVDKFKKLIFAIKFDGTILAPVIFIKKITLGSVKVQTGNSYKYLLSLATNSNKVLVGIFRTGQFFANKARFNVIETGKTFRERNAFSLVAKGKVIAKVKDKSSALHVHSLIANKITVRAFGGRTKLSTQGTIFAFIIWGQSNGTGLQSAFLEQGQLGLAYMLRDTNPSAQFNGTYSTLVLAPMIEPFRGGGGVYPQNVYGQTPSTMFHRTVAGQCLGADFEAFYDTVAIPSQPYSSIKKGGSTNAYASGLFVLQAAANLAAAQGKKVIVPWAPGIHGESDWSNSSYGANLLEHHNNIQADWKPITTQQEPIPLAICQQAAFPYQSGAIPYSSIQQWTTARDYPGAVILIEPRYQYHCADVAHLDAWSTRRSGGKWAEVFDWVIVNRKSWRPLQPISAVVSGSTIKVKLEVPYGPIRFYRHFTQPASININGTYQTNPWFNGRGFEVNGASNAPIAITKAEITGYDEITLTIGAGTPTTLRYALSRPYNGADLNAGPENSCRGTVIDSDPFIADDVEVIRCGVTNGSATITSPAKFKNRGWYDRVSGLGVAKDAIVRRVDDSTLTLSDPWTGATGYADLMFWHDQVNFLVQFEMAL